MCEIFLMRHGRTPMDVLKRSDGWLDLPLSDQGRMGIVPAQQYLKLEKIKTIFAPPLRRTEETAHIVQSGILSAPDVKRAKDAITWDLGILAGTPKRYSKPKVVQLMNNPNKRPKGGETYGEFKKRYMGWFKSTVVPCAEKEGACLVLCSGSNLRLLGKVLLGNEDDVNLDEGGLAKLTYKDGKWEFQDIMGDKDTSRHMS